MIFLTRMMFAIVSMVAMTFQYGRFFRFNQILKKKKRPVTPIFNFVKLGRNPWLDIVQFRCPRHRTTLKYVQKIGKNI